MFSTTATGNFLAAIEGLAETAYDITLNIDASVTSYNLTQTGNSYAVTAKDTATAYFVLHQLMLRERSGALKDGEYPCCIPDGSHQGVSLLCDFNFGNTVSAPARRLNYYNPSNYSIDLHNVRDVIRNSPLYNDDCKAWVNGFYNASQHNPLSATVWEILCAKIDADLAGGTTKRLTYMLMADDNAVFSRTEANKAVGDKNGYNAYSWAYLCKSLALKYPQCTFLTSYYYTSEQDVLRYMPRNVGIMYTTYGVYQGNAKLNAKQQALYDLSKHGTARFPAGIVLYDYLTAFRDHFRVFPVLKHKHEWYSRALDGVYHLYINGANYSREFLGMLKLYVINSAVYNPSVPFEVLIDRFFTQYAGGALKPLQAWYLALEDVIYNSDDGLHIYQTHQNWYETQWAKVDNAPVLDFLRDFDFTQCYNRPNLAWDVLSLWLMAYKANWMRWLLGLKAGTIGPKNFKPAVHSTFDYDRLCAAAFADTDGVGVHTWLENFQARAELFKAYLQEDTIGLFESYAYKYKVIGGNGDKYLSTGVLDWLLNWTTGHDSVESTGAEVSVIAPDDFAGHVVTLYFETLPACKVVAPDTVTHNGKAVAMTTNGVWTTGMVELKAGDVIKFRGAKSKLSGIVCM